MILSQFYNFFTKIFAEINELRSYDGDIVDISNGRMKPALIMNLALSTAKEKEWISKIGQPDLTANEPSLFHYTRRKQLVWFVNFSQHLTEEERENEYKNFNVKSVTFAVVKIDDSTGKVISAEFTRPFFNEQ